MIDSTPMLISCDSNKIIAIVGPSGVGKDTLARLLSDETCIPILTSYTTRPIRDGEVNGREHFFVSSCNTPHELMIAYTQYGGYEYWTELSQINGSVIYVIDEKGLITLQTRFPYIKIFSIYVSATESVRKLRGVSQERIDRDLQREGLPLEYYDYHISNNKSIKALKHKAKDLAKLCTQGYEA